MLQSPKKYQIPLLPLWAIMAFSRVNSAFTFTENELLDCMYHIYKITAENWNGKFCSYAGIWKKWCTLPITISVTKIKPQSLTQVSRTYIDNHDAWQGRTTPRWKKKGMYINMFNYKHELNDSMDQSP